ncbi:hypothetical protein [Marivita sp.]|uniref:hypothetical protein n=1 Tax=Marivita sp. TaxID=2003365 RepID=UPI0025BB13FB|nr:hypothetical protein [Marivita sp.]
MTPVKPPAMLSRLALRLRERRQTEGGDPALTAEDRGNIESFEALLSQTLALLSSENEALVVGDVGAVAGFYEEKAHLLKSLELRQPAIEPFLREGPDVTGNLRDLIRELADQLQVNGRLLQGMAKASEAILGEIERTRSREGLRGLYDKSGQLRDETGRESAQTKKTL